MSADKPTGPPMIAATAVMKPQPIKIGRISNDIVLPRAIPLMTALVVGGAAIFGAIFGTILAGGTGFGLGAGIFGFIAYIAINYSPLRGESFARWIALVTRTKTRQTVVDGKPVVVHVGIARVQRPAAGKTHLVASSVEVSPLMYDERGVLRDQPLLHMPTPEPTPEPDLFPKASSKPTRKQKKSRATDTKPRTSRTRKMPT